MKSFPKFALKFAWLATLATLFVSSDASAQSRAQYESMVATHAAANNVPEALVHRVIVRESKYHPNLVGRGGTIGLMQIKLATARGLGYTGDAAGLRDPNTNLAWGTKYLAGAYRAANSDHSRAVRYYASGYYYAAKRQRIERPVQLVPVLASGAPPKIVTRRVEPARIPADANALQVPAK
jgi:soluble lytic murein transglycosylase-like protein